MALEEADLMLAELARGVRVSSLHAEMIVYDSAVDCCGSLRDEFRSSHRLAIPIRSTVQGYLDTLGAACIRWILEG